MKVHLGLLSASIGEHRITGLLSRSSLLPIIAKMSTLTGPGDSFVLEDSDDYAAVLGLTFCRFVGIHRQGGPHFTGGKHVCKRNLAFLLE